MLTKYFQKSKNLICSLTMNSSSCQQTSENVTDTGLYGIQEITVR